MEEKKKYPLLEKEKKAGLYLTISFHLILLIIFLIYSIHSQLQKETSFVLDFTKQEEQEREVQEQQMKESVSEELDALIKQARSNNRAIRNVAVDASKPLKDDRNKNPRQIYDEAEELQKRLDASRREAQQNRDDEENVAIQQTEEDTQTTTYSGPSVLTWRLDGRNLIYPHIPAYKCQAGGDVAVAIIVNRKGSVVATRLLESVSSTDQCLIQAALKSASRTRFSSSSDADERQAGEIVFRFLPQ